jgi:hypothetical protein
MTDDARIRQAILELLTGRGGIGLTGNRESWSRVQRTDGRWMRTDGDPMTGATSDTSLTDDEVLRAVFWKARDSLGHYGPDDGRVGWADVLAWLQSGGQ